jgi:hypothetical protein
MFWRGSQVRMRQRWRYCKVVRPKHDFYKIIWRFRKYKRCNVAPMFALRWVLARPHRRNFIISHGDAKLAAAV